MNTTRRVWLLWGLAAAYAASIVVLLLAGLAFLRGLRREQP